MKANYITDFQVRGNYRNYNLLTFFLKQWKDNKEEKFPVGYIPSQVEYIIKGETEPRILDVNFEETHFLSKPDIIKAKEYLAVIISAREGDLEAAKILKDKASKYYCEKLKNSSRLSFVENEYIVPSISTIKYDDFHISQKGAMLLNLVQDGYPVPDFCILTSKSYLLPDNKRKPIIMEAISNLEKLTNNKLGSYNKPLIFAMRCAMPMQIPGMMPTYLNIGVTLKSYIALKEIYGNLVASKIYLNNLKTMYNLLCSGKKENILTRSLPEITIDDINYKIKSLYDFINSTDERLLWDPYYQVDFFIKGARNFYEVNKDLLYTFIKYKEAYPSLILQKMVLTVRGDDSYPGVIYTRHSRTGLGTQIESLRSIFGEEIMTGNIPAEDNEYFNREEIKYTFPAIYHFDPLFPELEKIIESPATVEFGVESASRSSLFAILQLNTSELTGRATLLSAVDMHKNKIISGERVVEIVKPYHLRQIFSERIDDKSFKNLDFFSYGFSILPRTAVTAKIYFSATTALEAKRKGEKVCFCKENFFPTDTIVMGEMDAIICENPIAIHVVTACRGFGIPALIDLQNYNVVLKDNCLQNADGKIIREGDYITISSKNRAIFIGKANFTPARFEKYLKGISLELEEKEKKVFQILSEAYKIYQEIVNNIDQSKIVKISELAKIIRNDLKDNPGKASDFLNKWFRTHKENYIEQILKSELGSHQEQHTLYKLLTLESKIDFFKKVINRSLELQLHGFTAGSFMLGRFVCLPHPVAFWKALNAHEVAFLINEFISFEKYILVLNEVGEKNLNIARKKILTDGLGNITVNPSSMEVFIPLKFAGVNWDKIKENLPADNANETDYFIDILQNKPFGYFYNYNEKWSIAKLKDLCESENIPLPASYDI